MNHDDWGKTIVRKVRKHRAGKGYREINLILLFFFIICYVWLSFYLLIVIHLLLFNTFWKVRWWWKQFTFIYNKCIVAEPPCVWSWSWSRILDHVIIITLEKWYILLPCQALGRVWSSSHHANIEVQCSRKAIHVAPHAVMCYRMVDKSATSPKNQ